MNEKEILRPEGRTSRLKRNFSLGLILNLSAMVLSYVQVPISISYLGKEGYGIWVLLTSVIHWLIFFDGGLGNGLKNRLSNSIASNDWKRSREYVSTTFFSLLSLALVVFTLWILTILILGSGWLGTLTGYRGGDLSFVSTIIAVYTLAGFVLNVFNQVYYSYQRTYIVNLVRVISQGLLLLGILLAPLLKTSGLMIYANVYGASLVIPSLLVFLLFSVKNRIVIPRLKYFRKHLVKDLLTLGMKFFLLQVSSMIMFTSDKLVIGIIMGADAVADYQLVHKLFDAILILHSSVLLAPLWPAYAEAYKRNDSVWIKNTLKKSVVILVPILGFIILLVFSFPFITTLWLGSPLLVSESLVLLMGLYAFTRAWTGTFINFINGTGLVNLQVILSLVIAIINVPLSFVLGYLMGLPGVIFATLLSLFLLAVPLPVQTGKIIREMSVFGK
ncbi:hypothetical protein V511_14845 [Mesotoga sp. Brook.08.YT.4.2.5.1]|uniref:oligosaccharide flippase family protein n=1 Tax=unclassified Mesotoga TaxID=1184398 RepID=UPI000C9A3339|nr:MULTISPECIES: oligosaccharide flippase family protein [unclassified Mesotoga]PNE17898.1 hypothetical protein V511_14845 [Mesotoga sp. Brook.08.YT.4.2.5.1]RAO97657.1 hypothetical protein M388_09935 [Mesotoga sp. Brook.08.YT.4.2.5.4.]RDI93349.1 hypothetical protein Q502_06200 [Mesotoga sp. Brook.08.YT.4.2.5.2.]